MVVAQGLLDDVLNEDNLSTAFSQSIALERVDGRYFARRTRRPGASPHPLTRIDASAGQSAHHWATRPEATVACSGHATSA